MEYGFERFELIMLVGMAYMGKRLYDVFLSAMLFYTYCHRVHFYFMGFLFISFIAAISTMEHVHMKLPAVCSLGACLYAMQCRRNLSGRYYYSLSYLYGACMHASCFRQCAARIPL